MTDTFAIGDVVALKSGGISMTVEAVEGDSIVCIWMDGKNLQKATFGSGTLKKYVRGPVFKTLRRG